MVLWFYDFAFALLRFPFSGDKTVARDAYPFYTGLPEGQTMRLEMNASN
jgi:hypothetical protein